MEKQSVIDVLKHLRDNMQSHNIPTEEIMYRYASYHKEHESEASTNGMTAEEWLKNVSQVYCSALETAIEIIESE